MTELQGRFGLFFLVKWPHVGARLEPLVFCDEARVRLCKRLRRAGAPHELLERVESSNVEVRLRVAPADVDGRIRRLTRRIAQRGDGLFTDARGWWDSSNAFLGSLVGATWSFTVVETPPLDADRPPCHTAS